jgi:L-ascorbate metabolism protein UlaG (beta-lactamase superfamily)
VIEALQTGAGAPQPSVRAVLPEAGKSESLTVGAIRVEFLRLSHGTGRFAEIQNLGHLVTLGGRTVLHVGDADMVPANFAAYDLAARKIDVVCVPYWYFGDEAGEKIIAEHFRPAQLIACHIPPDELVQVAQRLAAEHPDVLVPRRALESLPVRGRG